MKRNLLIIGMVVLLAGAGIAFFGWRQATASAAATRTVPTVAVQRGALVATVSAAGNVSAPSTAALAFTASGRVAQVAVRVGDSVKKGQLLMQQDKTDLALALKTAQNTLASQQANLDSTQASLAFEIKTAQANLASAQAAYGTAVAKSGTAVDQLIAVKMPLDAAKSALVQAKGNYADNAWKGAAGVQQQYGELQTAQATYDAALAAYNITAAGINDTSVRAAQAAVEGAQIALDQANKNLDTSLRTAQASLDNAQVAVDQAQRNLDNSSLYSPYDGLVSAVNYSAGDSAGTTTAVSVVDLSQLLVQVSIAEVDVARLRAGETAEITMDALPDKTYTGQVIAVGPVGTVTSGVVNYPVTVALTNADAAVKPGLTANLSVEVERRDNVLLVPSRAIRTQNNRKVVTVVQAGQSVDKPVTTGLASESTVEITAGLSEGDQVVVSQTQTTQSSRGAAGGIMIPGIGGAGGPPPN